MSLATRSTTAFFFVIVMAGGIFGGPITFCILFLLITILCMWEFLGLMMQNPEEVNLLKILGTLIGALPFLIMAAKHTGILPAPPFLHFFAGFIVLFSLLFLFLLFSLNKKPFQDLAAIALGVLYIGVPYALIFFIAFDKANNYSALIVLGLLVLSWVNDSGAYLLGSKIGKTPLFPRVSPKKTWEGSISGVITTFIVAFLLFKLTGLLTLQDWMAFAFIVAVFGSLGDLVESMLKRSLNIKDSGSFLPGHGGFLDRFDAFVFLLPFAAFYMIWMYW